GTWMQQRRRGVLYRLLLAEEVDEGDPHALSDGHQRVANLLQNPDHGFAFTIGKGVEPIEPRAVASTSGIGLRAAPSARISSNSAEFSAAKAYDGQPKATNMPVTNRLASVSGISTFQPKSMSWSMRTRGSVARSQNTTEM